MGLDLALGVLVLIAAVRGWFKGFVLQAITLAALVGCVYLADPLRDAVRPYARDYLPKVDPGTLDRLLWWVAAVVGYVATSGMATGLVKMRRRRPYLEVEPNRSDQGAGFLLGAAKGLVVASFLAAAIARFGPAYIPAGGAIEGDTKTSRVLAWAAQYRPAERIWTSPPVQAFVAQVRSRGFGATEEEPKKTQAVDRPKAPAPSAEATPPVRTASRPRTLEIPHPALDPSDPDFESRLDEALRREGLGNPR